MGVPRLFKFICENYRNCVKTVDSKHRSNVDNFFFDANALLHLACQQAFGYGKNKNLLKKKSGLTFEQKQLRSFELFFTGLVKYTRVLSPNKLIYLAIDGCAPLGKQAQQRQRRFVSAANRMSETDFDTCNLTPGTRYMLELTKFLNYKIRYEMSYGEWRGLQVMFSPPSVPGEGEHKVLEYIRSHSEIRSQRNALYGPDGDLIMLGLVTYCDQFLLIRENLRDATQYSVIDCGLLGSKIHSHLGPKNLKKTDKKPKAARLYKKKEVLNDFVLLGFFVGNDFLPKIQMFHLLEEGVFAMYDRYRKLRGTITEIKNNKSSIQLKPFVTFITSISISEYDMLTEQIHIDVKDPRFLNLTLLDSCDDYHTSDGIKKVLNDAKYREKYYTKAGVKTEEDIETMCAEYLRGLCWVYDYYITRCPSFRWFYPYHYAPLFTDFQAYLQKTLDSNKKTRTLQELYCYTTEDKAPSMPFQQLLSVLPRRSANLLPPEYSRHIISKKGKLASYYPKEIEIDYEGKVAEYQGVALLPFVDHAVIKKVYDSVKPRKKYIRNTKGTVSSFTKREEAKVFRSSYGVIERCRIEKKIIDETNP